MITSYIKESFEEFLNNFNKPNSNSRWLADVFDYLLSLIQGYNYHNYWRMRAYVTDASNHFILKKIWYLYRIKRIDAKNHCSFGTSLNGGAIFKTPPFLEHGPSGIIVGHDAKIGKNCYIFQQVTIAHGNVVIGDNVIIGAGVKILPNVSIGDNVKIGANAVVVEDLPDNSTCVLQKPRIIKR